MERSAAGHGVTQRGDDIRSRGLPFLPDTHGKDTNQAAYFISAYSGKTSFPVDHAMPDIQSILQALVAQSDTVIENFKFGSLEKQGLDDASLSAARLQRFRQACKAPAKRRGRCYEKISATVSGTRC